MPLNIDFHIHFPLPLPTNNFIFLFFSISKSIYFYSDRAALEPSVRGGVGDRVQYTRPQKGRVFPVPFSIDQAGTRKNSIGVNRLGGIAKRGVPMEHAMKSDSLSGVEELSTVEPCIILGYSPAVIRHLSIPATTYNQCYAMSAGYVSLTFDDCHSVALNKALAKNYTNQQE